MLPCHAISHTTRGLQKPPSPAGAAAAAAGARGAGNKTKAAHGPPARPAPLSAEGGGGRLRFQPPALAGRPALTQQCITGGSLNDLGSTWGKGKNTRERSGIEGIPPKHRQLCSRRADADRRVVVRAVALLITSLSHPLTGFQCSSLAAGPAYAGDPCV
eukprot:gene8658-biopygen13689